MLGFHEALHHDPRPRRTQRSDHLVERAPERGGSVRLGTVLALLLEVVGEVLVERSPDLRVLGHAGVLQHLLDLRRQDAGVGVGPRLGQDATTHRPNDATRPTHQQEPGATNERGSLDRVAPDLGRHVQRRLGGSRQLVERLGERRPARPPAPPSRRPLPASAPSASPSGARSHHQQRRSARCQGVAHRPSILPFWRANCSMRKSLVLVNEAIDSRGTRLA